MLGLALETTHARPGVALNCGERCKLPITARQPRGRTTVPRSRGRLLTPGLKGAAPESSQPGVAVCLRAGNPRVALAVVRQGSVVGGLMPAQ